MKYDAEASPLNFLETREEYRRELHRLNQLQAKLMAIFDAKDAVKRGVALHVVQALTGHKSLGSLGEYLQASEAEVLAAIGA
jgi:hypothetical protein